MTDDEDEEFNANLRDIVRNEAWKARREDDGRMIVLAVIGAVFIAFGLIVLQGFLSKMFGIRI